MWLENERVNFLDLKDKQRFFKEIKEKSKMSYIEIAKESKIPIGRLRLYQNTKRSLPKTLFDFWMQKHFINLDSYKYNVFDINDVFVEVGRKGSEKLKQKYGKEWLRNIGKQRMQNMRKEFNNNPEFYRKWRKSIKHSLVEKYGKDCYRQMGFLGGKAAIEKADKKELRIRLKKAFRKSFKSKIEFNDMRFRSAKELEVAKILTAKRIKFSYEKEISGFYPDFLLNNKTIIEVVGFDWKPHIERTRDKIKLFTDKGFSVVLYTYPNMAKHFDDLPVKIALNESDLINVLGFNRG